MSGTTGDGPAWAVEARSVGVRVNGTVLIDAVDLAVPPGGWLAVVGPNGAGKTTLLRALAGVVAHTGTVSVLGEDLDRLSRRTRARRVAYVPQIPVIPPGVRVTDYVLLGRTPHLPPLGAESAHDLAVVADVLDLMELGRLAHREVATLSGGERQRTVLARALAQEAPVLLLDEPTSALDLGHAQEVLEIVDRLRSEPGVTVISVMHDLTLAAQYAATMVVMDGGRTVAVGPPGAVLRPDLLARHWGAAVRVLDSPDGPVVVPRRRPGARPAGRTGPPGTPEGPVVVPGGPTDPLAAPGGVRPSPDQRR